MTASRINSALFILALAAGAQAVAGCSSSNAGVGDGGFNFGDAVPSHDAGHAPDAYVTTPHDSGLPPMHEAGTDAHDAGKPMPDGACNALVTTGSGVGVTQLPGQLPLAIGGMIPVGSYTLIERDSYSGTEATDAGGVDAAGVDASNDAASVDPDAAGADATADAGADGGVDAGVESLVQRTLALTSNTVSIAEVTGTDPGLATSSYTYEVAGRLLSMTVTCPTSKTVTNDEFSVVDVSGSGPQLWLLFTDSNTREVYAPQ
jgi:hypothetical protein